MKGGKEDERGEIQRMDEIQSEGRERKRRRRRYRLKGRNARNGGYK